MPISRSSAPSLFASFALMALLAEEVRAAGPQHLEFKAQEVKISETLAPRFRNTPGWRQSALAPDEASLPRAIARRFATWQGAVRQREKLEEQGNPIDGFDEKSMRRAQDRELKALGQVVDALWKQKKPAPEHELQLGLLVLLLKDAGTDETPSPPPDALVARLTAAAATAPPPLRARLLYVQGALLQEAGKSADAEAAFRQALVPGAAPELEGDLYARLGAYARDGGRMEEARAAWEGATASAQQRGAAWYELGWEAFRRGDCERLAEAAAALHRDAASHAKEHRDPEKSCPSPGMALDLYPLQATCLRGGAKAQRMSELDPAGQPQRDKWVRHLDRVRPLPKDAKGTFLDSIRHCWVDVMRKDPSLVSKWGTLTVKGELRAPAVQVKGRGQPLPKLSSALEACVKARQAGAPAQATVKGTLQIAYYPPPL